MSSWFTCSNLSWKSLAPVVWVWESLAHPKVKYDILHTIASSENHLFQNILPVEFMRRLFPTTVFKQYKIWLHIYIYIYVYKIYRLYILILYRLLSALLTITTLLHLVVYYCVFVSFRQIPSQKKNTFSYMNTILFCNINLRSHPHTPGRYQKDVSPTVYVSEFLSNCGGWKGKFLGPSSRGPCGSRHGESLILCSPHWRKRRCVIPYGHRPHMGHV